jgi:hypothetical protein
VVFANCSHSVLAMCGDFEIIHVVLCIGYWINKCLSLWINKWLFLCKCKCQKVKCYLLFFQFIFHNSTLQTYTAN